VWVWQNGDDVETLEVVKSMRQHPRLHEFYHSHENKKLREPTNWLWSLAKGAYLSKVDDDCIVPHGWIDTLRRAHEDVAEFGIISCWHFREEDYDEKVARHKIKTYAGGHRVMVNCWTGGSGYLMKRQCLEVQGTLTQTQSFTDYGIELAKKGWINGWYFPFLYQDHMDDPRSVHCRYKTEEDFQKSPSLSAGTFGHKTLAQFRAAHHEGALDLQRASTNPWNYTGWRGKVRRRWKRIVSKLQSKPAH
jgi:hypothetical protein